MKKNAFLLASTSLGLLLSMASPSVAHADPTRSPWPPIMKDAFEIEEAPSVIAGEIVVDFEDDISEEDIARVASKLHITLRDNSPGIKDDGKIDIADVDPSQVDALIAELSKDPHVEGVERATTAQAYWTPNDPKFGEQWHMTRAGGPQAWEYACGQGVTVAVVDTGVACYDQDGFQKGTDLVGTTCVGGYNFVGKNEMAADDQGHGTHVAGTIAQTTNNGVGVAGLAHCAKLMPVKVLSSRGWGTMADVAEGIRWAADHGAQVINLSLGSSQKSPVVEKAVKHALAKGVVVVAAAGNSGRSVGYPAGYAGVIAVSATDKNDNIAWFSSRGPEVAIGAPGVGVTQQTICENGKNKCEVWGVFNGTSMASPHVAGAAALLVGQGITDPDAVKAQLQATATPKEDKNLFGAGILEAGKAAFRTHWMHVAVRLAALVALFAFVARGIKKKGGALSTSPGTIGAALVGAVGLLPILPLLGIPARSGAARVLAELAMKPLGEWTLLVSPALHKWLPLASALPVLAATALFFGSKRLRPMIGGLALGTAALLVQMGMSGEVWYALGGFMMRIWAVANIAICLWVARLTLDKKNA